jgi:SNF2 family DNA or RNA helicase
MHLLPYQEEAVQWLQEHEKKCAILAYDMGLGKTVVSCALLAKDPRKTLVIAPSCILSQWSAELSKHVPQTKNIVYHGANRKSIRKKLHAADVIITTPHVLAHDIAHQDDPEIADMLSSVHRWIIDEAHQLRNSACRVYKTLCTYAPQVENKIFLTGTPVCNNPTDIISLICLSNLAEYNDIAYWKHMRYAKRLTALEKIVPDVLLRKTKEDTIASLLPGIITHNITLNMDKGEQRDVYSAFMGDEVILRRILRMRQALGNHAHLCDDEKCLETAVKISAVNKIIADIPATDKIIIFSYFTTLLTDLHENIKNINKSQICVYHGEMNIITRNKTIKKFREDANTRILLINLRAGGCGLNLIEANHVILMEPYWNESEQQQAINRVYRLGQKKEVSVYRLQIKNSIETWLKSLQKVKNDLSKLLIDRADISVTDIITEKENTKMIFQDVAKEKEKKEEKKEDDTQDT